MQIKNNPVAPRDGDHQSPWQAGVPFSTGGSSDYKSEALYDVLVIGAGITGLTTALLLQDAGAKIVLVDAWTVGFGTTGGTSAHINTFADTTYKEAEKAFGMEGAQLFADAINDGFGLIKANIAGYRINCDYEEKPGFLYAENEGQAEQLAELYQGAIKVGVNVNYTESVPTPVNYIRALKFENQAQFHPLKYLRGVQKAYLSAGGVLLENTKIESVTTDGDIHIGQSGNASIKAKKVIYATHLPPNINVFNFECAPYRSYVMAIKLKNDKYPDALIYDLQEPYHYVRNHTIDGQRLLIVGGCDHKTGHEDAEKAFADLEKYIRKYYSVSSIKYRWSSQYYVPVDGLPYIGQMPLAADGIYCATGFNGNGMMLGSISAKILSDLVLERPNRYADLFSPSRIKPIDGFTEFVKENADVAYHLVIDRFGIHETDSLKRLSPGVGKVVEVEGKKIAAYRDEQGAIHTLSPVCTHAGCIVNWNAEEKSWDCPCHGARYDINGQVLTGPAVLPLKNLD